MKHFVNIARKKAWLRDFLSSRLVAWLAVGALLLFVLFKVALPLFVSTASVRTNMEHALSAWTGAKANIAGDPQISFWPHPVLTLRGVTFEGGDPAAPELLAKADAIAAGFDIVAALRGTPVFYDFHLVNPVFKIERKADGTFNWRRAGWMADAIADASGRTPSPASETPIGDIEIVNGTVEIIDTVTASTFRITSIAGSVQWPTPTAQVSASLSAVMNGEKVDGAITCDEPLMLFSGQNSGIQVSFTAPRLNFNFKGTGNASPRPFASGRLQLTAHSFPALLAWADGKSSSTANTGTASIDTSMTLSDKMLKMDALSLSLDGANATGVLDIDWKRAGRTHVDGTLGFDKLDLSALQASFGQPSSASTVDTAFLKHTSLDLRLSAQEASYGSVALTDVAAGVMAEDGRASLDIGDGTYAGGSLSGRVTLVDSGAGGGQMQFSLKDADLAAIAAAHNLTGPLPLGRSVLTADLATTEPLWAMTLDGISGDVRYLVSNGAVRHFNLAEFETLAAQTRFFNLSQVSDGSFGFATADISATLGDGAAELTRAEIKGGGRTLSLAGMIPYGDGGLALAGAMRPDGAAIPSLRFFAGGTWPNPVISPVADKKP